MTTIGTIINFCSIDYKFIRHCIQRSLPFSQQVVVPYADHLFDGSPEKMFLIERARLENPQATFVEFAYHHSITEQVGANFWHNYARWVGLQHLDADIDYVLLLDADEIVETHRFQDYLKGSQFEQYDVLNFTNYYYFRETRYQALTIEDSPAMVRRSQLNRNIIFHDHERTVLRVLPKSIRKVDGLDGKPMFHHYSWVRDKAEMLKKVTSWGHSRDNDKWAQRVNLEFEEPFCGMDFIHGYKYQEVTPLIEPDPLPVVQNTVAPEKRGFVSAGRLDIGDLVQRLGIHRDAVSKVDLAPLATHVANNQHLQYFLDTDFKEHYRLLAYLGTQFSGRHLFDIGTYMGYSALALSYHRANTVISYDIGNFLELHMQERLRTIAFHIGNALEDPRLLTAPLIALDITHDGESELRFYQHLQAHDYQGLLFLDDIHLNPAMESFWQNIREPKVDLTALGHWSGSGLVAFGNGPAIESA